MFSPEGFCSYVLKSYLTDTWKLAAYPFLSYPLYTAMPANAAFVPLGSPFLLWQIGRNDFTIHRKFRIRKWETKAIFGFLCLTDFTQSDALQWRPFPLRWHSFILLQSEQKHHMFCICPQPPRVASQLRDASVATVIRKCASSPVTTCF